MQLLIAELQLLVVICTYLEIVNSQFLTVDLTENGKIQQICRYSSMKPLLTSVNKVNAIFGTILRKNPICNHY